VLIPKCTAIPYRVEQGTSRDIPVIKTGPCKDNRIFFIENRIPAKIKG
jgi:hypothetical protein